MKTQILPDFSTYRPRPTVRVRVPLKVLAIRLFWASVETAFKFGVVSALFGLAGLWLVPFPGALNAFWLGGLTAFWSKFLLMAREYND